MGRLFAGTLGALALTVLILGAAPSLGPGPISTPFPDLPPVTKPPEVPQPAGPAMSIWEAYSRGMITITQVDLPPINAPVGYRITNSGTEDVTINELVVLLSPNPRESSYGATTQDGILTTATLGAGSSIDYGYGEYVVSGTLPGPAWWCSEAMQFVLANIQVALGGEVAPFDVQALLASPDAGTQTELWAHLASSATLVLGKTVDNEFWEEIPETAGRELRVVLRATNIAIKDTTDGQTDPDAPSARVWDFIPAGYTFDPASATPGYMTQELADGRTRVSWDADIPAADVTGWVAGQTPSPYQSRTYAYTMITPHLTPGRVTLPRAMISVGADFVPEAHSEEPVLDVFELPPDADAGDAYEATENNVVEFSAAGSTDPAGDPLMFRWDFQADGSWDTQWSTDPLVSYAYGDDVSERVRVEVSDGTLTDMAEAPVTIDNVAPPVTVVVTQVSCQDDGDDDDDDDDDEEEDDGHEGRDRTRGGSSSGQPADGDDDEDEDDDDEGCGEDDEEGFEARFQLQAHVTDPGSDDITFTWSGDCAGFTGPTTYPNDPAIIPDPDPSPEVNPRDLVEEQTVVCASAGSDDEGDDDEDDDDDGGEGILTFAWSVQVEDDDGGVTVVSGTITIGSADDDDDDDDEEEDD